MCFAVVAAPGHAELGVVAIVVALASLSLAFVVRPLIVPLMIVVASLGIARAELPPPDLLERARALDHVGAVVFVTGTVIEDPRSGGAGYQLLVSPDRIHQSTGRLPGIGNLLVRVRGPALAAFGDQVEATGALRLPVDRPGFDRREFLALKHAYLELQAERLAVRSHGSWAGRLPGWIRDRFLEAIHELVPQPYASLLLGIVLGIRSGVPAQLERDLVATGLVHLLVLSGLKVAVFARMIEAGLRPLLGRIAIWPCLFLVGLYAVVGGATPAAVRAASMGGLALLGARLGRPTHVWTSLALVGAVMLGWRPETALDVGFQLSFAGTAAIILLTPAIEARLGWMPGWFREPFAVTCAAQVGTLPMTAADFHVFSPIGPIANALVLPLLPAMVAASLLIAPLALVPDAGRLLALPLVGTLAYLAQVATVLARVPGAAISVPVFPQWAGFAYYTGLCGAMVAARTHRTGRKGFIAVAILGPLLVGGGELVAAGHAEPVAVVVAVGDGQAVLLSGPEGAILLDGGPSRARLEDELGQRLPPWRRRLDGLVVTAPSQGHVGGLAGLGYPAGTVYMPAVQMGGSAWRAAVLEQTARGAGLRRLHAGDVIRLSGFRLEFLSPRSGAAGDQVGAGYLALRAVGVSGRSFCHFSDLDRDSQTEAAAQLRGPCDYLLLPDGGRTAPAPELLARARPRQLVASTSGGRLDRELAGRVLRTDQEGTIVLPL
jgi:competence protein ComEC